MGGWLYQAARFVSLKMSGELERRAMSEREVSVIAENEEKLWSEVSGSLDAALGDYQRARDVLVYERAHKNRPEVIQSALVPARFVLLASNS